MKESKAHHVKRNELAWQVQEKVENLVENKENKGKSFKLLYHEGGRSSKK